MLVAHTGFLEPVALALEKSTLPVFETKTMHEEMTEAFAQTPRQTRSRKSSATLPLLSLPASRSKFNSCLR